MDRIEQDARAEMVAAAVIAAAGGKIDIPTVEDRRQELIAALDAEEKQVSAEQRELMDALGVSG